MAGDAQAARDRLAALLVIHRSLQITHDDEYGVVLALRTDQAIALADRIEKGDAAIEALGRVEALAEWRRTHGGIPDADLDRALAATGTDAGQVDRG